MLIIPSAGKNIKRLYGISNVSRGLSNHIQPFPPGTGSISCMARSFEFTGNGLDCDSVRRTILLVF